MVTLSQSIIDKIYKGNKLEFENSTFYVLPKWKDPIQI